MLSGIKGLGLRRACVAAAALALGTFGVSHAQAEDAPEKSAWSFSASFDFTSHFISYGADVWQGGNNMDPWSGSATHFGAATATVAITPNFSAFVNVWSDLNDNVDSGIGGNIQEIDFNTGVSFTVDKFSFSAAHGFWNYASSVENVLDFSVGFNDADMIVQGFALNPTLALHWRYDGEPGQNDGFVLVPGIKPAITVLKDTKYPVTLALPISVGIFLTDDFQGGSETYGYGSIGGSASVPLAFIPPKYGAWSATASITYFNTPNDAIPGNPSENFFVTDLGVGVSF